MPNCNSNCDVISGIKCEVKNCTYHTVGDHCEAGKIEVGYTSSCNCAETACTTFKPKEN